MLAIFCIKRESFPDNKRSSTETETKTQVHVDSNHIHDHHKDESSKQPTGKNKKVLSFQTFEFNRPPNSFINMILHSNFIERMNAILLQPQSGKYMPQTSSPPFYSCQGLQMKIYYTLSPLQSVRRLHRSHRSAWLQDQNSWLPFGLLLIYLLHHFLGLGAHFGRKSKWQILTEFLVFDFSCFITFLVRNPRLCGLGNKGVTGMK